MMKSKKISKLIIGVSALSVISIVSGLLIYSNRTKGNEYVALVASTKTEGINKESSKPKNENLTATNGISRTYDLVSKEIHGDRLMVSYPYVNDSQSSYVNEIFKSKVDEVMNDSLEGSSFDLYFNLGINKNSIISVNYKGIITNEKSAHPSKINFGATVDMKTSKEIKLQDLFNVSDDFYNKIKSSGVVEADSQDVKDAQTQFICTQSVEDLKTNYESYFLENDGVVFVFSTIYAIGEHAQVKVPYSEIEQYMNGNYFNN